MKFFLSSFLLLFTLSCNSHANYAPSDLIAPEKMSIILEDVLLLESHYQTKYGVPGVYKEALDKSILNVFKKHRVTRKRFQSSYLYYASHPEYFKSLNTGIMDRLSREKP